MKGSKRRGTAVSHRGRQYPTVQRQRADFPHQTALALRKTDDTIYLEDVRVANLVRNPQLAKSLSDAGWAAFRSILEAPAAGAGRRASGVGWSPCHPPTPRRTVAAARRACPRQ